MKCAVLRFGGSTCDRDGVHVLSEKGNLLAMMSHTERASEKIPGSVDGITLFDSMIGFIERKD